MPLEAVKIWTPYDTLATAITVGAGGLADSSLLASDPIDATDPAINYKQLIDLSISFPSGFDTSSSVNPAILIWICNRLDGLNYEFGSGATVAPPRAPDGIIVVPLYAGTVAYGLPCQGLRIGPDEFIILMQNKTGATLLEDTVLQFNTYGTMMQTQ